MKTLLSFLVVFLSCLVLFLIGYVIRGDKEGSCMRYSIQRYQELRLKAEKGDLAQAASALKEVLAFWPPWVSREGSTAWVVVAFRDSTVREILTRMRLLSGEDLGTDPEAWLKKYYKEGETQSNERSGVDAGTALCLHLQRLWSSATHRGC